MRGSFRRIVCVVVSAMALLSSAAADEPKVAQRWALLVGVDDYATADDLEFCGNDQRELRAKLLDCGFEDDHVFLLHDKAEDNKYRPSQRNIERELGVVLNLAEENDLVIVSFSGHGVAFGGKSYLCPNDAQLDEAATLVSLDNIYDRLNNCAARFKLIIVDACRDDPRVGGTRSLSATAGTKQLAESLRQIKLPQGVVLLNSCAPGEVSWEEKQFSHGVYMHHILEGLGGAADTDADGALSLNELQSYAGTKTKTYVARKFSASQRPFFRSEGESDLMQVALLPVPTGARPLSNPGNTPNTPSGGVSRFPRRTEIGANQTWIGDSRFSLKGRSTILTGVLKGGPAHRAGLQANDVLVSAGGTKITLRNTLFDALAAHKPGDVVDFEIERDGKPMIVPVTLDAMPADGGLEAITTAAEAGEAWAMVELALRYSGKIHQHYYVQIDAAEGLRWIQKAVEAGSNLGLILLGEYYYSGRGGAVDNAEALRLLEQARLQGLRSGPERWQADEVSVIIGELYFFGRGGVTKNRVTALEYFRTASDNGHVRAMNFLATMYENGEVVNKDLGKALELYQICAEAGNADAQYNIGIMIYNGVLSSRNLATARQWIELAANNGNDKAMFALGVMMENGEGGPRSAAQAYEWYRKAAAAGNADAAKKLQ